MTERSGAVMGALLDVAKVVGKTVLAALQRPDNPIARVKTRPAVPLHRRTVCTLSLTVQTFGIVKKKLSNLMMSPPKRRNIITPGILQRGCLEMQKVSTGHQ